MQALVSLAALALLGPVALFAAGCGGGKGVPSGPFVLAANTIAADWAHVVGGEGLQVESLLPANVDPHTFQLRPADIRRVAAADLVVLMGGGLEAPFEDAIRENAGGPVVALAAGLPLRGGGEAVDAHFWLDPSLAARAVASLAEAMSALDPAQAGEYRARAAAYASDLEALDREIAAAMAALPPERRLLVTFHDAYAYFADRYGLEVLGFVVERPDEEPSAAGIAALVSEMKARAARIIFTEPEFSARVVDQVARETGAEVRTIPSGSLAPAYPTYVDYLREIARVIAR